MDLFDQMRTFVRIVDTGRIHAAAKSLGMSVAAVSRQLAALEKDLGASLVVRSTRQLSVTDRGRRWYQYAVHALAELETARADVAEGDDVRGHVVVSAPISFALAHIVDRCEALARAHPRLAVELRLEDQAVDLLADGVDIAVRIGMTLPDSPSLVARRLVTFRRTLLAAPSYLRRHGTPKHPDDLLDHALLVQTRASPSFTRWRFARDGETVDIPAQPKLASTSPVVLREWAARGAGITLVPEWMTGELKVLLPAWKTPEITAYALHRADSRGAARVRVVLDSLATIPASIA